MNFVQATEMHAQTVSEEQAFTAACDAQAAELKTEAHSLLGIFKNVLAATPADAIRLPSGHYLYMKAHQSTRTLTEERIGLAIDHITLDQLRRIALDLPAPVTVLTVVCASIYENLMDECAQTSYTPMLAKRRVASARSVIPTQDVVVIEAVQTYLKLKNALAAIRRHKAHGRHRCNTIKDTTGPILSQYLHTNAITKQDVVVQPPSAMLIPALPPLPVLPVLPVLSTLPMVDTLMDSAPASLTPIPILFTSTPTLSTPTPTPPTLSTPTPTPPTLSTPTPTPTANAPVIVATETDGPAATYQVQQRVYTSRGKAPRLAVFTNNLPGWTAAVVPPTQAATEASLKKITQPETKQKILTLLLTHYNIEFNASKGKATHKIHVAVR